MKPQHMLSPGEIIKDIFMKDLGLNQATLADELGCTADEVDLLISGKSRITPAFAMQLAAVFDTTVGLWTRMQRDYDRYLLNNMG